MLGCLISPVNAATTAVVSGSCKYPGQVDVRGLTAYSCTKGSRALNWSSPITLVVSPATLQSTISGNVLVKGSSLIQGMVTGSVYVLKGAALTLQGMVNGSIYILPGGKADIMGMVNRDVVNQGGVVSIEGTIAGTVKRTSGSTKIASGAVIGH